VPNTKATRLGPYIASYGHDDRVGVYSSLIALLNSPQPKHTSIVCGFDNEEVGSTGHAGASGHFFDEVLNRWLLKTRTVRSLADLTEALKLNIFSKSFAIDADAEVGATAREEDKSRIDIRNVPKLGFGPFVNCSDGTMEGDQTSPTLIDRIMRILGDKQVPFQPTGTVMVADMAHNTATMNCFFERRGLPVINVGPPVGSLHSPEEIAHVGDIYRAYQAYMAILEDSKGQKERSVSLTTSSNTR
jgi:aspartyl aminopeptidase